MPKRTDISSILVVGAALILSACGDHTSSDEEAISNGNEPGDIPIVQREGYVESVNRFCDVPKGVLQTDGARAVLVLYEDMSQKQISCLRSTLDKSGVEFSIRMEDGAAPAGGGDSEHSEHKGE